MRSHVEFRSPSFPAYADEQDEINPGRYGKRVAEYLQSRLPGEGVRTGDIWPEDWGWGLAVENPVLRMWIGCGNYEEYPDGFLCFIEPSKPVVWRLPFRRVHTGPHVERVADALDRVLRADAEIRDVRWWEPNEAR